MALSKGITSQNRLGRLQSISRGVSIHIHDGASARMVATDRVWETFADARALHASSLERLEAGDIRDAAEKAWCAARRATDALILARTGGLPPTSSATSKAFRLLRRQHEDIDSALSRGYAERIRFLHGDCFYDGQCDPLEDTEILIRSTSEYIEGAENLV